MKSKQIPEIRFSGFTGDWRQQKFGDIYDVLSGFAFKRSDYVKVGVPIINGESIQHGSISIKNLNFLPEVFLDKYQNFVLDSGDIVLGLNRPITNGHLKIAQVPKDLQGALLYQRAGKIIVLNNTDINFSYQLLENEVSKFVLKEAVGSDQPFISTSKLKNWLIIVPSQKEEQSEIGEFYNKVVRLISFYQQELTTLKQTKQGFLQKMFPKEGESVPEVRFPGFTGDWEVRKLDSIVDKVKSYSLSRDVETSEYTGYKYIHYGDIHTKVADIIDGSSNLPNIKAGSYELLEKGDLVLADASEDYQGIATPAIITMNLPYNLVSGLHTIALRPKSKLVDSLFLYYLINSPIFRKYGYKAGTGMKVFGISATNLLKFENFFPVLEEQVEIGIFLKRLDDTIALHQSELDALKETKKAFLQKMFV